MRNLMFEIKPGDILKKSNQFYRVHDFARQTRDVVVNLVLYNPQLKNLVIAHEHIFIAIDDIGEGKPYQYISQTSPEVLNLLEIVKRKWKLLQLSERKKQDDSDAELV